MVNPIQLMIEKGQRIEGAVDGKKVLETFFPGFYKLNFCLQRVLFICLIDQK
jgi:hypothetical protein